MTAKNRRNSETKIWHVRNNTLLKAKYQYLTSFIYLNEVRIGRSVCGCQMNIKYARKNPLIRSEANAIETGRAGK